MVGIAETIGCWSCQSSGLFGLPWQFVEIMEAVEKWDCGSNATLGLPKEFGYRNCQGKWVVRFQSNG